MAENGNEFMYGLVGGLMILALLLLIFNTTFALSFDTFGNGNGAGNGEAQPRFLIIINGQTVAVPADDDQRVVAAAFGENEVGTLFEDTSFFENAGTFDISSQPEAQVFPGGTLKNGLLFGEESMRFVAENPQKIRVFVAKENNLGDFIMLVNGVVQIKQRLAAGVHVFELNENGETFIELRAESSDWKIWAPTLYELERVEIENIQNVNYFSFSTDTDKFSRGSIEFDFTQSTGTIEIIINGQSAYKGATGQRLVVPLGGAFARNIVAVKAVDGIFAGTASVVKVNRDFFVKKLELAYNIDNENNLPGWIAFDIAVLQPGTLVVKNIHESSESLVAIKEARSNVEIIQLRSEHVSKGENTLVVEAIGDALFLIRDLHVIA